MGIVVASWLFTELRLYWQGSGVLEAMVLIVMVGKVERVFVTNKFLICDQ